MLAASIAGVGQSHAQRAPTERPFPRGLTPRLAVEPASLTFSYEIGSRPPADQQVQVSSGVVSLTFSAAASETWLSVNPTRGTTPQQLSVHVSPAGLTEGTYRGTITLNRVSEPVILRNAVPRDLGAQAPVQPRESTSVQMAVTLIVRGRPQPPPAPPRLIPDPSSLTFSYEIDSAPPADQAVRVASNGVPVAFRAIASGNWLSVNPTGGTTPQQVSVRVNPAGMTEGTYNETIALIPARQPGEARIGRAQAAGAVRVMVTLIVRRPQPPPPPPRLIPEPSNLTFSYEAGSAPPADKAVRVDSNGVPVAFRATTSSNWLSVNPDGGTTPQQISVRVNPAGLKEGTYNETIALLARAQQAVPVRVVVTLIVRRTQPPPPLSRLTADPSPLSFTYEIDSRPPPDQTVRVSSEGSPITFRATASSNWLSVSPAGGATPQELSVKVNPVGLAEGRHDESIALTPIQAREVAAEPVRVAVTLMVIRGQVSRPPQQLQVDPPALSFSSEIGAAALAERPVLVRSDRERVSFTVTKASNWLSITPATGTTPQQLSVRVNTIGLPEGTYSDTITLRSAGTANVAQVIVTVVVTDGQISLWWLFGLAAVLGLLGLVGYQRRQIRNMVNSSVRAVAEADPPVVTIDSGGEAFVESEIRVEITSDPGEQHLKSDDVLVREVREE